MYTVHNAAYDTDIAKRFTRNQCNLKVVGKIPLNIRNYFEKKISKYNENVSVITGQFPIREFWKHIGFEIF